MRERLINLLLLLGLVPGTLLGGWAGYELAAHYLESTIVPIVAAIVGGFVGLIVTVLLYIFVEDLQIFD